MFWRRDVPPPRLATQAVLPRAGEAYPRVDLRVEEPVYFVTVGRILQRHPPLRCRPGGPIVAILAFEEASEERETSLRRRRVATDIGVFGVWHRSSSFQGME